MLITFKRSINSRHVFDFSLLSLNWFVAFATVSFIATMAESREVPSGKVYRQMFDAQVVYTLYIIDFNRILCHKFKLL